MRSAIRIIVLSSLMFATGCTDDDGTIRTLRQAGYTNIRTTGYRWMAGEDTFRTGFEGSTIRID